MSTNITENRTLKIHVHGSLLIVRLRRKKSQTKLVFAVFENLPSMLNIELSNRDGNRGEILAAMCEEVGLPIVKSPSLSSRVCNRVLEK